MIKCAKLLAKKPILFSILELITTSTNYRLYGFTNHLQFRLYICDAWGLLHKSQYLSLSTAPGFFNAPHFLTSNDNDK
jgi:hypothetical protein